MNRGKRFQLIMLAVFTSMILFAFLCLTEFTWYGANRLSVKIHSQRVISRVTAYAVSDRAQAEHITLQIEGRSFDEFNPAGATTIQNFVGQPFIVLVHLSGRDNLIGIEVSRIQDHALVVIVEFEDGTCTARNFEIPDFRGFMEIDASLD